MSKHLLALVLLSASLATATVDGTISGTVVDDRGVPVQHMILQCREVHGMPFSGSVPQAETDESGHFSFKVHVGYEGANGHIYGLRWAVTPQVDYRKKDGYYVDQFNRFYHVGHSPEIEMTPEAPSVVVEVKLDPRGGALMGKITDAATGAPISDGHMELAWTSDPTRGMGSTTGSNYRWLLPPDRGITVHIQAKGYKPQEYQNITVGSGQDKVLDIQLQPEDK